MNATSMERSAGDRTNARPFVEYLERLAGVGGAESADEADVSGRAGEINRAALARLRRTLGKSIDAATGAYPYVVGWTNDASGWREECYYLVAALFAFYPQRSWHHAIELRARDRNFGASFLALEEEMRGDDADAGTTRLQNLERRFTSLIVSRREDLPERLRHAIALLKAHDVPIDWVQLLRDLWRWKQGEDSPAAWREHSATTQRDWAKSFWRIAAHNAARTPPGIQTAEEI